VGFLGIADEVTRNDHGRGTNETLQQVALFGDIPSSLDGLFHGKSWNMPTRNG